MKLYKMAVFSWMLFLTVAGVSTDETARAKNVENSAALPAENMEVFKTEIGLRASACPDDMVEVQGEYCPNLQVECLYNIDMNGTTHSPGDINLACGEYKNPSKCLSEKTVHIHYCIDRYEWPNKQGQIPQDWMTYFDAEKAVALAGKRLCTHKEWTLAAIW